MEEIKRTVADLSKGMDGLMAEVEDLRKEMAEWFIDTNDRILATRPTLELTSRQWSLLLLAVAREINVAADLPDELADWQIIWRKLMEIRHGRGYDHEDI